jgi:hypothetical protein
MSVRRNLKMAVEMQRKLCEYDYFIKSVTILLAEPDSKVLSIRADIDESSFIWRRIREMQQRIRELVAENAILKLKNEADGQNPCGETGVSDKLTTN